VYFVPAFVSFVLKTFLLSYRKIEKALDNAAFRR